MRRFLFAALLVSAALAGIAWFAAARDDAPQREIGLFTSLPIVWNEAGDLKGMLDGADQPHWARAAIEGRGRLVPLDTLLDLSAIGDLIIAQPRPLTPDENVALDSWVRAGGHALIFADPMLTQDSHFALGDRRRPQDVAMISPILARWGLELRFDDGQPAGEREIAGERIPVNLAGEFAKGDGGQDADCRIAASGLIARCRVGKGRAVLVADAALLERGNDENGRIAGLKRLLDEVFAR
ncbi:MAG: ABC transporter [Novosphingobium sp.]|nr:ABC transporter [Novosphingobium sp.]